MRNVYLIGAIVGTVVPYYFFIQFFLKHGIDLVGFLEALFANGASGGFAADIIISSAMFWSYLASKKEPMLWMYVVLNLTIGLSCALPLYLYLNSRESEGEVTTA